MSEPIVVTLPKPRTTPAVLDVALHMVEKMQQDERLMDALLEALEGITIVSQVTMREPAALRLKLVGDALLPGQPYEILFYWNEGRITTELKRRA